MMRVTNPVIRENPMQECHSFTDLINNWPGGKAKFGAIVSGNLPSQNAYNMAKNNSVPIEHFSRIVEAAQEFDNMEWLNLDKMKEIYLLSVVKKAQTKLDRRLENTN